MKSRYQKLGATGAGVNVHPRNSLGNLVNRNITDLSMNIPNREEANTRFMADIYKPCVENFRNIQNISFGDLDHGTAVLNDELGCDKYIAYYGGHHFHKLYAAFASTNFQYTDSRDLEIIDWGCGQALATCVLVDYLIENRFKPNVVSITLIEPSLAALKRGHSFTSQMFQPKLYDDLAIRTVNKYMDDLEPRDLISDLASIKVHLFSNIIDVEEFSLDRLHDLILSSFQGRNRFICTSPWNDRRSRLDNFCDLFSQSCKIDRLVSIEDPIDKEVFYFNTGRYENRKISRCERQFTVNLAQP